MESHVQSTEDILIPHISYKNPDSASYVVRREMCSFYPSGSDIYQPTSGVRVIRINLNSSEGWVDPSSIRIVFDVNNTSSSAALTPFVSGAWGFIRRYREVIGGQTLCDYDHYNRFHQMFANFQSTNKTRNEGITGFGSGSTPDSIAANKKRTVSFSPIGCITSQMKYIPLKYTGNFVVELELVSNESDCCRSAGSQSFNISNVQLKCDICSFDSNIENEFSSFLLSGKNLNINATSYSTQDQVCNGPNWNINLNRSLTRLKSLFCTIYKADSDLTTRNVVNKFYNSMEGTYDPDKEMEFQVTVGSRKYPSGAAIASQAEAWDKLQASLGTLNSSFHSSDITENQYCDDRFVWGIDFEKIISSAYSGISTASGDVVTIKGNNTSLTNGVDRIFTVLHFDVIIGITSQGIEILE